ncbi:MAG: hypothetical protein MJY81_02355 [Bacteroidaceae bacterium]|nr:hypothetical protein [Bacteroidaceae bacterium]
MNMEEYHIGKEIEKEVRKQYPSIDTFAKALHRERQTVYDIFKRAHIATDRLMEVSRLLNRDFFKEFSNVLHFGETSEEEDEAEVAECISQLMPENELQVIRAERLRELIDEFFLSERMKPMIIMHDSNDCIVADLRKVAEDVLGKGMVKSITIKQEDIFAFETSIARLSKMPQKTIEINYTGSGNEGGFDDIILLAERLATESGKHVVVFCTCINALGILRQAQEPANNRFTYCSWAEECFDTWHKRVHILVADNESKDFARRQELYKASQGEGYIDRALAAFEKGDNDVAGKILGKALNDLSTYQFEVTDVDTDTSRFYVRTLSPTQEEKSLLEDCDITPRLTMWFDMSKSTAKLIEGGETFGDYVPSFDVNSENMWVLMAKGEFK